VKFVEFSYRTDRRIQMGFHSHPFYEIYYFHGGRCNYVIGPKVYTLRPGDLIIMHGMTLHTPNPDFREPYVRSILHFHPDFLGEYVNRRLAAQLLRPFEELRNGRAHTGERRREVEALLEEMNAFYKAEGEAAYGRFLLRFFDLLYIVGELFRQPAGAAPAPRGDREAHVQRGIEFIEAHYAEDVTMERIERELHVSRHYLARLFKEWTGWTIFRFLYQRRINQAKTLFFLDNDLSVSDVAERVGFKHLSHFSRVFKRLEGVSPEAYRKRAASAVFPGAGESRAER